MTVKELSKVTTKNGEVGCFCISNSFLTNLENWFLVFAIFLYIMSYVDIGPLQLHVSRKLLIYFFKD